MVDILQEFLSESREGLDQLDLDFITLEQNPNDSTTLANVFRTIHTIKGTSGFLGFPTLELVTHMGENLIHKLRNEEIALDEVKTSLLLEMVDVVREQLDMIAATGSDGGDYQPLIDRLELAFNASDKDSDECQFQAIYQWLVIATIAARGSNHIQLLSDNIDHFEQQTGFYFVERNFFVTK